jgi:hypothetical protein
MSEFRQTGSLDKSRGMYLTSVLELTFVMNNINCPLHKPLSGSDSIYSPPYRFAYIEFGSKDEMAKAFELDGSDFNGRSIVVNEASSGGPSGGSGGGRGGFSGGRGQGWTWRPRRTWRTR